MRRSIFTFRKRAFLNPASTNHDSYIHAVVESSNDGEYPWGSNMLTLADCGRRIQLEFFVGSARARKLSLKKINLLIKILIAFRDALTREIAMIDKKQ